MRGALLSNPRRRAALPETDEVHVWRIALDSAAVDLPERLDTLSSDERARADRFRFPSDRAAYVLTRAIARELLADYCGVAPTMLTFDYGPAGKPRLTGDNAPRFNISHSGMLAVIAIARREVGIDVERRKPPLPEVSPAVFSANEAREIRSADDPLIAFYDIWTRKEALVKAMGTGLGKSVSDLVVGRRGDMTIKGVHLRSLDIGAEYSGAVAMDSLRADALPRVIISEISIER